MPRPMRSFAAFATAVALGLSSAFLVACGDRNNLIPKSSASEMRSDLDEAARAVATGRCTVAARAIGRAATSADELPASVDSALRRNLAENFKVVSQRVAANCEQTTTPTTTATTATETQATTVETVPTVTTTTPTPSTNPTTTPDSGGGQGITGGGGSGSGGTGSGGTGSGGSGGTSGGTGTGGGLKPPTD